MSRCLTCDAEWSGQRAAHCTGCHRTFSSDSAADRHFVSAVDAGCHDPATLRNKKEELVFQWNERRRMWSLHSDGRTWPRGDAA